MFCPSCGVYMEPKDLFKTNVIKADDGTLIDYDAFCPNCTIALGHMSWGVLTSVWTEETAQEEERLASEYMKRKEEDAADLEPADEPEFQGNYPGKRCPYCGKVLPKAY